MAIKRLLCRLGWHFDETKQENVSVGGMVHTFINHTCGICKRKKLDHYMIMDHEAMVEILLAHIKEFGADG